MQMAARLVRDAGFDPVVVGKLADARRFQRGKPGYGQNGERSGAQAEARRCDHDGFKRSVGWSQRMVPRLPRRSARSALWSFGYFFMLLAGYYVLRPLRDQMGIAGGVKSLPWLFTATFVSLLVAQPIYGALVARLPRARFIPSSTTSSSPTSWCSGCCWRSASNP